MIHKLENSLLRRRGEINNRTSACWARCLPANLRAIRPNLQRRSGQGTHNILKFLGSSRSLLSCAPTRGAEGFNPLRKIVHLFLRKTVMRQGRGDQNRGSKISQPLQNKPPRKLAVSLLVAFSITRFQVASREKEHAVDNILNPYPDAGVNGALW